VQKTIFEQHGCTQQVCHGSAAQGGLDLSPDVAYQNIFDVRSTESVLKRVAPGDKDRSYLWLKLAAKTKPGMVDISGAPMPNGLPALSDDELEALRLWIYSGAPRTGTVEGTQKLLNACLPAAEPITIKPLDPPAAGEGLQFVLPPVPLPKKTEQEVCFATYYDVTQQVPRDKQDPTGRYFRFSAEEIRQDPQSHHIALIYSGVPVSDIHDPLFGPWTCASGERAGSSCEPTDLTSCGSGTCRSEPQAAVGCVGFGPPTAGVGLAILTRNVAGAQQAQSHLELHNGVFAQIPMTGILYWNSHAFNLTESDFVLNGRLNFTFAADQRYPVRSITDISHIFDPNAAPYTMGTYCADHVMPQGSRLFQLSSHTHRRGKHFVASLPGGAQVYENFIYNDPKRQLFDPPLAFDSPDPAERTIHFCSTYNNGVAADGSPDPVAVTRASRVPESARRTIGVCSPVACVSGKVGAACSGTGDDATCDSSPGAGDGLCDACNITGGESTENEMFLLIGQYYIDPAFPTPNDDPGFAGVASVTAPFDASGRSTFAGFAAPPSLGCASSPGGHAAHIAAAGS
jgi:hypothetical protein